jgi:hypothetical protein
MSVVTFTTAGRTRCTTASTGSLETGIGVVFSVVAGDVVSDGVLEPTVNEHALATAARIRIGTTRRRMVNLRCQGNAGDSSRPAVWFADGGNAQRLLRLPEDY